MMMMEEPELVRLVLHKEGEEARSNEDIPEGFAKALWDATPFPAGGDEGAAKRGVLEVDR